MSQSNLAAAPRLFDDKTDAQIVEMTFPRDGLFVSLSTNTAVRYSGSRKLPPGPPNALAKNEDGSYSLTRVAIVRVHPETHIRLAQRLIRKAALKSLAIGLLCGAITAAGMVWYLQIRQSAAETTSSIVAAPCLVSAVASEGVSCQIGTQIVKVSVGRFFPDGQFQLQAVGLDHKSFTVVRTIDHSPVIFQLDPTQLPQPQGGSKK